jgi:predicted nucleic acid-binding protein
VLIAVVSSEPSKAAVIGATRGAELIAPPSVPWEIGNALSAMLRRRRVSEEEVLKAIGEFERIPLALVDVELDESLRLASQMGIYAYDAYLIRCALRYRCPLLTLDRRLAQHAGRLGAQLVEVGE